MFNLTTRDQICLCLSESYVTVQTDDVACTMVTNLLVQHHALHRKVARAASASGRALAGAATAATLLAGAAALWSRCCRFARRTYAIPRET